MGIEGIRNISNAALFNTMVNLEYLDLSSNNIQSKGFIYIIKSIERGGFPMLQELNVRCNDMKKEWVLDNHITDDGLRYLIQALTRSAIGVVSKIQMAGMMKIWFVIWLENPISKEMIETCGQALSGQDQLHISFVIQHIF